MNRRLPALVVATVLLASSGPAALAEPSTPQVQVLLPVVDGGVTVVVAPATTPLASAPLASAPPAPATAAPPGSTTIPLTLPAPATPAVPSPVATPSPASPAITPTAAPTPPTAPASPTPTHVVAPQAAAPGVSAVDPSWPVLPSARPTYLSPGDPTATTSAPAPPIADAATTGARPATGGPFLFGVFGHSTDRTVRFQEKVGRPVEVIGVFPSRGSWDTVMDTWWLDRAPEGFRGTLDVGVPLWQEDGDLASAAAGGDVARWEELGRVLHERYPGSSVRIGWEFNLGGWNHHATEENVEQWKQAFRHASAALKKGGPSLLVTWNPNKGRGDSLADASTAWPGDDVVDIVAIDAYDWWPAYSESTWPEHRDGDQGWQYWVDFARAHGKQFAVPEWGVAPGNDHGGGDNPYYIGVVMDFLLAEHAKDGIVHSAVYFDEPDSYIANSIGDGQVPVAGQALADKLAGLGAAAAPPPSTTPQPGSTPPGPVVTAPSPVTPPVPETAGEDDRPGSAQDASVEGGPTGPTGPTEVEAPPEGESWAADDGHGPVPR